MDEGRDLLPIACDVDQEDLGVAIVIPHVVRRELEVPLPLAGGGIDRDHRIGVEVVSLPLVAVPVRARISRRPKQSVRFRVIGAGVPSGSSAGLVRLAPPGLDTRLTLGRDRVVPPHPTSGRDVICVEEASYPVFTPGHTDDRQVAHHEGGAGGGKTVAIVGDLGVPEDRAGKPIEGEEPGVQRGHQDGVSSNRYAPIHRSTTVQKVVRLLMVVPPIDLTGRGVEGEEAVIRAADVHDAVVHDG